VTSLSLATLLLAAAVPLGSPAPALAKARLAALGANRTARRWWHRAGPAAAIRARLLPVAFAVSTGALAAALGGWPVGAGVAVAGWLAATWARRRAAGPVPAGDQLATAATWDLLAACLRAGLPVPTAVLAVAGGLPAATATALRSTSELLALGADPVTAWEPALLCPDTAQLARGARRTARSGTALAGVAGELASTIRAQAGDLAEARAQRAGVLITGPLGLCFLPAFVCLGIVPVVIGLAAQLSVHP
jgi:Flp pilus assembly protein TadB